jgi:PadR family transcriptional regulator PadR
METRRIYPRSGMIASSLEPAHMAQDSFVGFIKLHVLHHAEEGPVYGLWLIEELNEHGYRLSPGTLYPHLHAMELAGLLRCRNENVNGKIRRYYRVTPKGKRHLEMARRQLAELAREILGGASPEEYLRSSADRRRKSHK